MTSINARNKYEKSRYRRVVSAINAFTRAIYDWYGKILPRIMNMCNEITKFAN